MKKIFLLTAILLTSAICLSQVTMTADSVKIKISKSGVPTSVLFTRDIKFGYSETNFYFTDKSGGSNWEYNIAYKDISSFNGIAKTSSSFNTFTEMRDSLILLIQNGKASGLSQIIDKNGKVILGEIRIPVKYTVTQNTVITAGKRYISIMTSSDFVGTILGDTTSADFFLQIPAPFADVLGEVEIEITNGSCTILTIE